MDPALMQALDVVALGAERLRSPWGFSWPVTADAAAACLRVHAIAAARPVLVALTGGASSGKSTVFNNLLAGHTASRITARGHATRGPVVAVHAERAEGVQALLDEGLLWPGLRVVCAELDAAVCGEPGQVSLCVHTLDGLRDVLLCDLPDLTSQAAAAEGEVTLSLLPWFDRVVVVVDHERWFDRQTISALRAASVRYGQLRFALFNRTRDTALAPADEAALHGQAERLAAVGSQVLDFRHGRGFCRFAPGTLDPLVSFVRAGAVDRVAALSAAVGAAANEVLNQNTQREAHLGQLRASLNAAVTRTLPTPRACMTALMTPAERRQLEIVARVLRVQETRRWLGAQTERLRRGLKAVPGLGWLARGTRRRGTAASEEPDRAATARAFYEATARRQVHEIQRVVGASRFWDEVERWTGQRPAERRFAWTPAAERAVAEAVTGFETALRTWTETIEGACRGISPHLQGAAGAGVIALAVVLVAVPGSVTALTLVSLKGALGAALGELFVATGAGALLGKPLRQLTGVIQERLIGSPEFKAVRQAAADLQGLLADAARREAAAAEAEAAALVLPADEPLTAALETLRAAGEGDADA